jgi:mannose-6-phosphate isomerase-like protein (cupin superfamily)
VAAQPSPNRAKIATLHRAANSAKNSLQSASEDCGGACSIFELGSPPRYGPPRHIHHREDEWYYALSGDFLFEVAGEQHHLPTGGSIWLPRDIPHCWANEGAIDGKLILMCQPGGFEKFFDEAAQGPPLDSQDPAAMQKLHALHAKYGMELLGPPLFATTPATSPKPA